MEYKTGYKCRHKTGEPISGQPRKEELEGGSRGLREKAGVRWGSQEGGAGGDEGRAVLNEACGRWGRGRCIPCSFRLLPPPQPFRASPRSERERQMFPDEARCWGTGRGPAPQGLEG